jgi:type VI secretion system FHA domain protein
MILTLEVTGPQARHIGAATKVFESAGGTIGRLPDNHWVLPDPHVSGRHAVIRYVNGTFFIEDTSTNGVFINTPENRLARGQPYALKSGDRIHIDLYEIRASITPVPTVPTGDPFATEDPFALVSGPTPKPMVPSVMPEVSPLGPALPGEDVDPLSVLGLEPAPLKASQAPFAEQLARDGVWSEHYRPPAPVAVAPVDTPRSRDGKIPLDYDPLSSDYRPSIPPAEAPSPAMLRTPPASARANVVDVRKGPAARLPDTPTSADAMGDPVAGIDLSAMLAAAGLDPAAVTPELARSFGRILRVVVSGVMDVLQARQDTKEEFRMGMTRFKRADNNPLKFSANVDDALHNLLVKRNAAYLGPVDAFEDAFEDLRNHQMATLAGMRVAFDSMLAQFNPDRLQAEFDGALKKGALLSLPARLRYWDLYRERFHDMVRDQEATFRRLFGDQFAEAYEDQLKRLKAQSGAGNR